MNRLFKTKSKGVLTKNNTDIISAVVMWRFDSMYFQVNFEEKSGRRVFTFDKSLKLEQSPSKYDPAYTLVRNVFENPRKKLSDINAWTPNGGLTYGLIQQKIEDDGEQKGINIFYIIILRICK